MRRYNFGGTGKENQGTKDRRDGTLALGLKASWKSEVIYPERDNHGLRTLSEDQRR